MMLVFSDLHLSVDSEDVVFGAVLPGITAAVRAHPDVTDIAFLGDWWHIRNTVPVHLLNRVRSVLHEWVSDVGVAVRILPGNHDQVDYAGRNALEVFEDIEGVSVYTEPTLNEHGLWVPYRARNEDVREAVESGTRDPSWNGVLWMHHGVKGALMNDRRRNEEGLDPEAFAHVDYVFCGHYHKRHQVGRVQYVGSPWQTKADESGQPKGYMLWDPLARGYEFVDEVWGPRFHRITVAPGQAPDLSDVRSGDEVRVTVTGEDVSAAVEALRDLDVVQVVTPEVEASEARLDVEAGSSLRAYAEAYARTHAPDGVDPEDLVEVYDAMALHAAVTS